MLLVDIILDNNKYQLLSLIEIKLVNLKDGRKGVIEVAQSGVLTY